MEYQNSEGEHFWQRTESSLSSYFAGTPALQHLRKLALDEPLTKHIDDRGKISLELDDG
jgi:hypothetical protein